MTEVGRAPRPRRSALRPAGYPVALEVCAALLAAGGILLSWRALERLPSTVVPLAGAGEAGLTGAALDAEIWTWTLVALWSVTFLTSVVLHRTTGSSPLPVLSVALFAFLALLRTGMIAVNLTPGLAPSTVVLRALGGGLLVLALAAVGESRRTRALLGPALARDALYDEPTPRGPYYWALAVCLLPLLVLPRRVRVVEDGLVAITPIGHVVVATPAIASAEPVGGVAALLAGGVNLATSPASAVRIRIRGRLLPLLISVVDRPRFLGSLDLARGDDRLHQDN